LCKWNNVLILIKIVWKIAILIKRVYANMYVKINSEHALEMYQKNMEEIIIGHTLIQTIKIFHTSLLKIKQTLLKLQDKTAPFQLQKIK